MNNDVRFMRRAITLAMKGKGKTTPNPCVGAVLVNKSGEVIGKGYHHKAGSAHAEVNCINSAKVPVKGSTLYVTLEPCCTFGKTPPCTDLIIKSGISRVVIGSIDPNPNVSGKGVALLQSSGLTVLAGVLSDETDILIEDFRKFITKHLPFITVKAAITLDGKIATRTGDSKWISSETSRKIAHYLRGINDGIMIGSGTAAADNPSLNTRMVKGFQDPVRILIDRDLKIDKKSRVFNIPGMNILITEQSNLKKAEKKFSGYENVQIISERTDRKKHFNWKNIFKKLAKTGMMSILIEGGSGIVSSIIEQKAADKFILFISPRFFGDSNAVPLINGFRIKSVKDGLKIRLDECLESGGDIMLVGYPDFRRV